MIRFCFCPIHRESTRPRVGECSTRWLELNQKTLASYGDPETQSRIDQYEMAFQMQTSVPELTDISDEPQSRFGHVRS